jgi:zinc transport system permease protein
MNLIDILQYSFIQRAFLAGSFVAISCSLLGLFLVLKKFSLIGDGLSHLSFGAIALGLFLGVFPLYIATPLVIIGALLILKLTDQIKIYGDTAIGIFSSIGIASGIILASLSQGFNVSLFSYLFGNILAISPTEVYLSIGLSFIIILLVYLFFYDLFAVTFDQEQAQVSGIKTNLINRLLVILTATTVVLSVRIVGTMLVSALLIIPAITSLQIAKNFRTALFLSAFFALTSVITGITLSVILNLPAGATIVFTALALFLASLLVARIKT